MDDNILPLILDAKTAKEAWDTLERCFGARGRIEDEDKGRSIETDVQRDENFVESHYAKPQVDDVCEEVAEAREKKHIDACEPQCA